MNHNVKLDEEFISRIMTFATMATVKSIITKYIKISLFNFINVLRFNNHSGMKLHYVIGSNDDLKIIINSINKEFGMDFIFVDAMEQTMNGFIPNHLKNISLDSSIDTISRSILYNIEYSNVKASTNQ